MKTKFFSKDEIKKKWFLVDAKDKIVGRLSTKIATILIGKNKAIFTPGVDCGDNVIVINAKDIKVTGKKMKDKVKFHYSGYPGGDKYETYEEIMAKDPCKILRLSIRGMLPKNKIGDKLINNVKIYKDENFKNAAQKPIKIEL